MQWSKSSDNRIMLKQLSGELESYVTRTVKFECSNKEGVSVVLQLYNTPYIPQAKANQFSLHKVRIIWTWRSRVRVADGVDDGERGIRWTYGMGMHVRRQLVHTRGLARVRWRSISSAVTSVGRHVSTCSLVWRHYTCGSRRC